MGTPVNPAERPARLPIAARLVIVALCLLSFLSGVMIWWGQTANESLARVGAPLQIPVRAWVQLHGALNPVLCVLFGGLLVGHIRIGWRLPANRLSGLVIELIFAGLILTAVGLYYAPEAWRERLVWSHRITGMLLPVGLAMHWIEAFFWVKRISK